MIAIDCVNNLGFIMRILVAVIKYVRIIVPIILIVMIIVDLTTGMIGSTDEKAKKEASSKAGKRLIYAIIVFLIPTVINIIFKNLDSLVADDNKGTPTSWISCWNYYNK